MIKALGLLLTILGMALLVIGVIGIFGKDLIAFSPWGSAILGLIFFSSGVGLLKRQES